MPTPVSDLFQRALKAQEAGDAVVAQQAYEQVIRLKPTASSAYNNLAALHNADAMRSSELEDSAAAVRHQRRAVGLAAARGSTIGPDALASAYVRLAHYLMLQRNDVAKKAPRRREALAVDAELALEHALTLSPNHQEARLTGLRAAYHAAMERRISPPKRAVRPTLDETHATCRAIMLGSMEARLEPLLCGGSANWAADVQLGWPGDADTTDRLVRLAEAVSLTGHGGQWLSDHALLLRARHTLIGGRPFVFADALAAETAEAVHEELMASRWECDPEAGIKESDHGRRGSLWMRRCSSTADAEARAMQHALRLFRGGPMKRLVAELTGETIDGVVTADWTLLPEGGFFSLHNDVTDDRRVSFAWHLTDGWEDGQGGELAFLCGPEGGNLVPPVFNQLTLFHAHRGGLLGHHAVLPVVNASSARRLALFGWFTKKPLIQTKDPRPLVDPDD